MDKDYSTKSDDNNIHKHPKNNVFFPNTMKEAQEPLIDTLETNF